MRGGVALVAFLTLLAGARAQGSYCIPPFKGDTYAGILSVRMNSQPALVRTSLWNEKYIHTKLTATVARGGVHTIGLITENTLSDIFGNTNVRVWVDWNHDNDFTDAGEEVVRLNDNALNTEITRTFTVPETALLGTTRMRVYCDMIESGGHDTPTPCGYEYSQAGIEHHGEVEDYLVDVQAAIASAGNGDASGGTGADAAMGSPMIVQGAPLVIPYTLVTPTHVSIDLVSIDGRVVRSAAAIAREAGTHSATLDVGDLPSGAYLIRLLTARTAATSLVHIVK
jgi:GEVED domain